MRASAGKAKAGLRRVAGPEFTAKVKQAVRPALARSRRLSQAVGSFDWVLGSQDQPIPLAHNGLHPAPAEIEEWWVSSMPFRWNSRTHSTEREMLYSIMAGGERIEALTDGYLRLGSVGMHDSRVVAAATNRRLLLLRKGILRNYDAIEISYGNVTGVDVGTLTITLEDRIDEVVADNRTEYRRVKNEKEFASLNFYRRAAPDFRLDIDDLDSVSPFVSSLSKHV